MAKTWEVKFQRKGTFGLERKRFNVWDAESACIAWLAWLFETGEHPKDYVYIGEEEVYGEDTKEPRETQG